MAERLNENYGASKIGQAVNTIQGKASAITQFNKMLVFQASGRIGENNNEENNIIIAFHLMSEDQLCNEGIFRKLADYLVHHSVSSISDVALAKGSAMQYLSGVKETIKEKFPKNKTDKINKAFYPFLFDFFF